MNEKSSISSFAQPHAWQGRRAGARYVFSLAFVVVLGFACIPVGYGYLSIGLPSAFKYTVVLAVLFLLTAAFGLVSELRGRHREAGIAITSGFGYPATEIRYSMSQFVILAALAGCLTLLCALAAWDFALAGKNVPASIIAAALSFFGAVFFLGFFVLMACGRLRRGRIVLSSQGIYQQGRAFSSFLPWEAIAGVKATYNGSRQVLVVAYANANWERRQLSDVWKLDRLPPVPMIEIDTVPLAADSTLVYHLVRHYVENPAARAELGTRAPLRRARAGTFDQLPVGPDTRLRCFRSAAGE